jgi:hypothetical protein
MSSDSKKSCPYCGEQIRATATKCRFCNEKLVDDDDDDDDQPRQRKSPDTVDRMLMPVGRPISAIAAGYCGLFSLFPFCGIPFAIAGIICGLVALNAMKRDPELSGGGRAWFGIVAGALSLLGTIAFFVFVGLEEMNRH